MKITIIILILSIQLSVSVIFLVVCFTTLLDFKNIQHRMVAIYINDKLASIWKEVATTYWRYSSDIFLDSLKKTMKNLSQQMLITQPRFELYVFSGVA
jgi:hypothetical protein